MGKMKQYGDVLLKVRNNYPSNTNKIEVKFTWAPLDFQQRS